MPFVTSAVGHRGSIGDGNVITVFGKLKPSMSGAAGLLPPAMAQFLDSNGAPLAGGSVYTNIPGTTTPKTTWQDSAQTTQNTNPIILDAAGRAIIYGIGLYRTIVNDVLGNLIYDQVTDSANGVVFVSVKDFGATGNGVTDDTQAIIQTIAALSTGGGVVYFPPGAYLYSSSISVPMGVSFEGSGEFASTLLCSNSTSTFILNGSQFVERLQFASTAPRTGGFTLDLEGNDIQVTNCAASGYYIFANVGTWPNVLAIGARFTRLQLFNPSTGVGSGALSFRNFSSGAVDNCIITGPTSGMQPDFGIEAFNGDTLLIMNSNITLCGAAMLANPTVNFNVFSLQLSNCLFDSAGMTSAGAASCMEVIPSGNVIDSRADNCWFGLSASASGAILSGDNGGKVAGFSFSGCTFASNLIDGLTVTGPSVTGVTVNGGYSCNNGDGGLKFENGTTGFSVTGHRAGNADTRGANGTGLITAGACNNYLIVGNNLSGNTGANLNDGASGSNKTVASNLITS